MSFSRRNLLAAVAALGGLALLVPTVPGQTGPNFLQGIDVSQFQGNVDWAQVKNSGIAFAYCRATVDATTVDTKFAANWPAMKAAGLLRGAYHHGRPGQDPIVQAQFFVNTVKPQKGDLRLMLDVEDTGFTPAQNWAWIQSFCAEVQRLTHMPVIIYTSPSYWTTNVGNPTTNRGCPLWIANWDVTAPTVPRAWSTWTLWQYHVSNPGDVPGISTAIDHDCSNGGSLSVLQALTYPRDPLNRH
jgi:lysozyme